MFQVDDIIVGLPSASINYYMTTEGTVMKVLDEGTGHRMYVEIIQNLSMPRSVGERAWVNPVYFVLDSLSSWAGKEIKSLSCKELVEALSVCYKNPDSPQSSKAVTMEKELYKKLGAIYETERVDDTKR